MGVLVGSIPALATGTRETNTRALPTHNLRGSMTYAVSTSAILDETPVGDLNRGSIASFVADHRDGKYVSDDVTVWLRDSAHLDYVTVFAESVFDEIWVEDNNDVSQGEYPAGFVRDIVSDCVSFIHDYVDNPLDSDLSAPELARRFYAVRNGHATEAEAGPNYMGAGVQWEDAKSFGYVELCVF